MSKASILVIFLAIFTLFTNHVCAQQPTEPNFVLAVCETEFGNYTTPEYDTNLKTVLATLLQQANSTSMFNNTSAGTGPDTVFGQYYCRGDIDSNFCGKCLLQAALAALTNCTQAKAAVVFYEECKLHYENQTLFGVESISPAVSSYTPNSNVSDPKSFFDVANRTFTELVTEAVSKSSMFATGEGTVVSANSTVYCLVQCSPDLNATQCDSCLVSAANFMMTCCGEWPSILYVFLPSCQMMYNTQGRFYFTPNAPPSPPAVSSPPQPSSTPPATLFTVHTARTPTEP